ncbi:MAG: tol-pal system-associated acyl-CoA thioesterase [Alphaproteobacteria bacterium]
MSQLPLFQLRVYYEDTDAGGIVYYANYLKFAERARTEWLRQLGFSQTALRHEAGLLFVVRECLIRYIQPAKLDDFLSIISHITAIKGASLQLKQEIKRDETLLASIEVELASISETGKPMRLPTWLK